MPSLPDCQNCPLNGCIQVQGESALRPLPTNNHRIRTLAIVGEGPDQTEEELGRPFVGENGKKLWSTLGTLGFDRSQFTVTNALLCRPEPGRKLKPPEWRQALACCRNRLHDEVCHADFILALGPQALQTLTRSPKIMTWAGSLEQGGIMEKPKGAKAKVQPHPGALLSFEKCQVLPAYHPDFVLREPSFNPVWQAHIQRALKYATGTIIKWRWRGLWYSPTHTMVSRLEALFASSQPIAVDVETQGIDPWNAPLMCIGFANRSISVSVPWESYLSRGKLIKGLADYPAIHTKVLMLVKRILTERSLIFQNGAYDLTSLRQQAGIKVPVENWAFDTLVAHAIYAPRLKHGLDFQALQFFHMENWKAHFGAISDQKGLKKFTNAPERRLRRYNAKDALATAKLRRVLRRKLRHEVLCGRRLFKDAMELSRIAFSMTELGMLTQKSSFEKHRRRLKASLSIDVAKLKDVTTSLGVADFNPNANAQIAHVLFEVLRMKPAKYSEKSGNPSANAELLESLTSYPDKRAQAFAFALLAYRRDAKQLATYVDGLPLDKNGVIHPMWRVTAARTGRWSSSPNLQNIAKGHGKPGDIGYLPSLRDLFRSRPGWTLVEADYSQLELRILTVLAEDPVLLAQYKAGQDVHAFNACDLFPGVTLALKETDPKKWKGLRDLAKRFAYAVNYGSDPETLWQVLHVDFPSLELRTVISLHTRWFQKHPQIYRWQQRSFRLAKERKYVESPIDHRRQYYYDGRVDYNEVLNYPVQATGAAIINRAILKIAPLLDASKHRLLLQEHDALVMESRAPEEAARLLRSCMTAKWRGSLFPVDVKVGKNWGSMKEL